MAINSCRMCSNNFYVKPSHVRMGYGKYCSIKCQQEGRKTGKIVPCFVCGTEVYKSNKALNGSKSKKYFCTKSCQTKWRNSEFTGIKHANFINGNSSYRNILIRNKKDKVCGLCMTRDVRVLAVHHVDENHKNNDVKNLVWLCHNCHHLVHHDKVEKQRFLNSGLGR